MRRFVSKAIEKTGKLSTEQFRRVIRSLSGEVEALTAENDQFAAIFESLSSGLLVLDKDFRLEQSNSSAERLLGFSINSDDSPLYGMPIWDVISEDEIAGFLRNASQKKITNAAEEFTTATEGGIVRFLSVTLSPLYHGGRLGGNIVIVKDITDKRNQDVLLHRMENLASLTNLASGMAHEIKNPLGAISIHIQLVQKALQKARENDGVLPARKFVENHIDVVNEEIEHLNSLVMDFLFAVRPINAKLELKNPEKIILAVRDFFRPEFKKFKIDFKTELSEAKYKIKIDEKLFRELLMNMAQNALAAIQTKFPECREKEVGESEINAERQIVDSVEEKGAVKSENSASSDEFIGLFKIVTGVKDGKYVIAISDNGCGMNGETLAKIFEPYYTTKANGTGLGMTMVYKIVKEFAGEIQVDSIEGKGTQFVILFPLPQSETRLLGEWKIDN